MSPTYFSQGTRPPRRLALAVATVAVSVPVLVQRLHCSYDVLAELFFAWLVGRVRSSARNQSV